MERFDITIRMYSADASGTQYVWDRVLAEEGGFVLYTDAQATIAALQARVQELKAIKIPDDAFTYCAYCGEKSPVDEHNEDLSAHIKVCPKHPIRDVEAQLTQRTAERDAARRRVDELEAREVDVVLLREDLEKRTAELERVRGELQSAEAGYFVAERELQGANNKYDELHTLIAALPKVEGEISDEIILDLWESDAITLDALRALLQHLQGMEG